MTEIYKICLLGKGQFLHEIETGELELNVLKEITFMPEISSNLEIEGNIYHVTSLSFKNKLVGVREISFASEDEVDEKSDSEFTCPYCLAVDHDAFELEDHGTKQCGKCGSEIEFEREVEITYRVIPVKKKEPINL